MTAHPFLDRLDRLTLLEPHGHVTRVARDHCEASGPAAAIGDVLSIRPDDGGGDLPAEVVGVDRSRILLVPFEPHRRIAVNARVVPGTVGGFVAGDALAGRAIDPVGRPIDGGPAIAAAREAAGGGLPPRPLDRAAPSQPLVTGIRAIDALLTLGEGQRIGIFAASGVGKTSLVEQLATQIACDRVVLCLVGERGREVEGLWRLVSARDDRARFAMVAATSDQSAALRARSVEQALALAEHWRDRGEHVLLLVDSITRLAMALRETGLAAGEPPTIRAYPPSVFGALPRVVERCGAVAGGGAITAVMTVLSETDDVDDPIAEVMKSLLDGHIILSRPLADRGHFPAIDVPRSISRQAARIVAAEHRAAATTVNAMLAAYEDARVLVESGLYRAGGDAELDRTVAGRPAILGFLAQAQDECCAFDDTVRELRALAQAAHG